MICLVGGFGVTVINTADELVAASNNVIPANMA